MATYAEKLKDPRWQRKRLEILQRDDFTCVACGDKEEALHVHHGFYRRNCEPWDYPSESLWTLCEACHEEEQRFMDMIHEEIGRINPRHYWRFAKAISELRAATEGEYARLPKFKAVNAANLWMGRKLRRSDGRGRRFIHAIYVSVLFMLLRINHPSATEGT